MFYKHYEAGKLTLDMELTTYCNARCPQCSRTDHNNNVQKMSWLKLQQVTLEQFKTWFKPEDFYGIGNIHFSGTYGDPGMCKDLVKIVEYIIDNGPTTISINTNGGMRSTDDWFDIGAIGQKRMRLIFDIDGIDNEMHQIYRRGVDLDKVLENMEAASMTPAKIDVLTVLFKHNQDYLEEIEALGRAHGATGFDSVEGNNFKDGPRYRFLDEDGNEQFLEQVTREDREQGLERMDRRVRDHRHHNIIDEYKNISCQASDRANMKVSSSGFLTPCCFISTPLEWECGRRSDMANTDWYITTTGKNGDPMNPTMQEFVNRHEDFILGNRPFADILQDDWYTRALFDSFKQRETAAFACKKVCGKL